MAGWSITRKIRKYFHRAIDGAIMNSWLKRRAFDYERVAFFLAAVDSARFFLDHMPTARNLVTKPDLLDFAVDQVNTEGLWLEFGVAAGGDIRRIGELAPGDVFGFDSFEGLPEDWTHFQKKGRYTQHGKLPAGMTPNVHLVKGWFSDTLVPFLDEHSGPIAFLHIDSDLYSSAKTVLERVHCRLQAGTVILFDDFLNYPGWQQGEFKAFMELVEATGCQYEFLGFASSKGAVALRITDPGEHP